MMILIPVSFAGLVGFWYYRKGGYHRGCVSHFTGTVPLADHRSICRAIRLPGGETGPRYSGDSSVLDTIASVPWFLLGVAGIAYEWVAEKVGSTVVQLRGRGGYRHLPVDEDAQILRFEDEE